MNINLRVTAGRAIALASLIQCAPTLADVTIQEQTTIHAFIVKAHGTTTNRIAANKQRRETQFSRDGVMSNVSMELAAGCVRGQDLSLSIAAC